MAICKVCKQEMLRAKGCLVSKVHIDGQVYDRIRVEWQDPLPRGNDIDVHRCGDCDALPGHPHHWGCDMECCPQCGMQLFCCDCEEVFVYGK